MSKKGLIIWVDDNDNLRASEQSLPIETYADTVAWVQDFWQAFLERPKWLRWIARIAMGRWAYRELFGTRESLIKHKCYFGDSGYSLKNLDYHKDKMST